MIKIHVDFMALSEDKSKVYLGDDLLKNQVQGLYDGLEVLIHEPEDFEVQGVIELNVDQEGHKWWYVVVKWETLNYILP